MKYIQLIGALRTFKDRITCPECGNKYNPRFTDIVSIFGDNVFFGTKCDKCQKNSMIQVQVTERGFQEDSVSEEDLKSLREGLRNFNGNISTFLK